MSTEITLLEIDVYKTKRFHIIRLYIAEKAVKENFYTYKNSIKVHVLWAP